MTTPFWLLPQWPAPGNVQSLCTTRSGGHSGAPYNSLNLGLHVGDEAAHVEQNRRVVRTAVGVKTVFMEQVHGTEVLQVCADTPDALVADVAVAHQPGVACTVMVADCLPVLFCTADGKHVAAAHAGWRGLLGHHGRGVIEAAYGALIPAAALEKPDSLLVWLGPCIGPMAFEVGNEVREAFMEGMAGTPGTLGNGVSPAMVAACFRPVTVVAGQVLPALTDPSGPSIPNGKWLANLPALARLRLQALGIRQIYGNDGSQDWCTVSNPSRFFSHRRDRVSGRMAACIWRNS